ncbi:glycosyltransferase family 4 protein [Paenibacillus sp. GCM10027626]|uniref:glycosyltransferase family 4 protein n=1 Tax=Paenibacillus sp. GCM10027626 TaxID=3273411 RepID=UPI00362F0824
MKIVIIAPEAIPIPPILGGSVEISILAIAKELSKWHSVTIVSRAHRRYPQHSVIGKIHIHRVPAGGPMKYLANVKRFLKGRSFDIVQIDNRPKFVGPIKSMFPNTTVSLFLHSLTFVKPPYASRAAAREGLRKADLIIANSASLKNQLSARFPKVSNKIRVAWLGVDTSRFTPSTKRAPRRAFTLLFAGRLIPRKGVPVLLKAAKLVRSRVSEPIQVIIAGGSTRRQYTKRLQSISSGLGVRARFLGTVPHHRIHRIFKQGDLFVCPSQKHEAFGLVNIEAMASGLPVVASNNGGIKEIVEHGRTGLLVKQYRKPQAFADAIAQLIKNKPLYRNMKKEARKVALKKFSWRATASKLKLVYESER